MRITKVLFPLLSKEHIVYILHKVEHSIKMFIDIYKMKKAKSSYKERFNIIELKPFLYI